MVGKRLSFIVLLGLVAWSVGGCRDARGPRRILVLGSTAAFEPIFHGLKAQLEVLGYREGVHVIYDLKYLEKCPSDPPVSEGGWFSARDGELIFALATEASMAAKKAAEGTSVPVVFAYAGIEGSNLVNSVREPGGNITGVRFPGPEQIGKRMELLHRIAPHIRRVWIGYQKGYPNTEPALAVLRPLSKSLNIQLIEVPLGNLKDLEVDLSERDQLADCGMEAMLLMPDSTIHSPEGSRLIGGFADRHKLVVAGSFLSNVREGAVFGNANDLFKVGKMAAPLVAKIFEGIPAGTIPVVTPEQDLYINVKRARELGLTVPEGLLRQATVIIR